jgi:3'-phosphoadenosine 5'-phosphosulfate sulfotransferase (PAPS reductase)/FAD synthetase
MGKELDIFEGLLSDTRSPIHAGHDELPSFHWDADAQIVPRLEDYDRYILAHSGGKDAMASLLLLLELGVPREMIELHHHDIDGREGSTLMDWPVTHSYVEAMGKALGIKVFFSWRQGGFEREMLRENCGTAPVCFTRGDGTFVTMGGERSKASTRRMFPQVTSDLKVRWCSGVLKVDVLSRLLVNDPRFTIGKTLVITGERAEESANRARYKQFEPNRCDLRNGRTPRWIDHWRPVHTWPEAQVWALIRKYRIAPHPAYFCGFGRTSCLSCIFGSANQWATIRDIAPSHFKQIADYERDFGVTIHRTRSVDAQADRGTCHPTAKEWAALALSTEYKASFFMDPWMLPAGAFGESCGPT